jgi:hypothetical protein
MNEQNDVVRDGCSPASNKTSKGTCQQARGGKKANRMRMANQRVLSFIEIRQYAP